MAKTLKTSIENGIMTIQLNRPEVLNAFNKQMMEELIDAFHKADADDHVRVIIVTGNGRAFCSGMDLTEGTNVFTSEESEEDFRDTGGQVSLAIYALKKPVIAAINGSAVGVGITMTLPMDIRIIKKGTKVGFVFGRRGIGPESASGWFLPKLVGVSKALEWSLTGRMVPSAEGVEAGLFQYEVEDPYEKALEIASDIVKNTSAVSNGFSRQLFWKMLNTDHPLQSHLIESRFLHWISSKDDVKEGIQSFLEKRSPQFKMSVHELPNYFRE